MKVGLVTKTRYFVDPDEVEVVNFYSERHLLCNASGQMTDQQTGVALTLDGATIISQLTNARSIQNQYFGGASAQKEINPGRRER